MARVETKRVEENSLFMKIAVAIVAAAILTIIVVFVVTLINSNEEDVVNPFEDYQVITGTNLETIIKSNKLDEMMENKYSDFKEENEDLYNILSDDVSKDIYILFYHSTSSHYADNIKDNENIISQDDVAKRIEEAVKLLNQGTDGDFIILLVDVSSHSTALSNLSQLLTSEELNNDHYTKGAPFLLRIETPEKTGSKAVFKGWSGVVNFSNMLNQLKTDGQ